MLADIDTIREFLSRIGHRVAVVARKPVPEKPIDLPDQYVFWPAQLIDPPDQIAWLADYYDAIYVNLNPLAPRWHYEVLPPGKSIRDNMIDRRTRVLLDIDAHDCELSVAAEQRDGVREWMLKHQSATPLMETESGNGYGLIYPVDFANDAESKRGVSNLLNALNKEFPTVDTSCFNAGRLTRVMGTFNRRNGSRVQTRIINGPIESPQSGTAQGDESAAA